MQFTDLANKDTNFPSTQLYNYNYIIIIAGGSLAKYLAQGLQKIDTDWSKWRVFFCDERHVAYDNSDSTYKVYKEGLMSKVPLADKNVIKINPELSGG